MRLLTSFTIALALGVAPMAAIAAPADTDPTQVRFERAMAAYERNQWAEAYAAFGALGDAGHAESARIALQMWRYGARLYRIEFAADAPQLERWVRAAGCGRPGAGCRALPLARLR